MKYGVVTTETKEARIYHIFKGIILSYLFMVQYLSSAV